MPAKWEKVCPVDELPVGSRKRFPLGTLDILFIHTEKRLYACSNECPHLGESLEKGELQGCVIRCSAPGYKMDLSSGKCIQEAELTIPIFPVEIKDGWIVVKI